MEIFRLLQDHDARVVVMTYDGHGNRVDNACRAHGLETIPVSIHCDTQVPRKPLGWLRYIGHWLNFMREVSRAHKAVRPDWVYVTNLTYFLYSWPVLLFSRANIVFTLPIPPDIPRGRVKAVLDRLIWRRLVAPICTQIVCNSGFTRDRLLATGARPRSLDIIYYSLPHRPSFDVGSALGHRSGMLRVTYVGRLTPAKGVEQLFQVALQVVQERADVEFYFAGDYLWRNPFAIGLVDRVKHLHLEERVVFTGEIEDVLGLLSESDLHVLFSTEEAFGLVVLEAKSQGVPSVVSPGGALPELVEHKEDGFICRDLTSEALREGIDYFLSDRTLRRRAGDAALSSIRKFERKDIGKQWAEALGLR